MQEVLQLRKAFRGQMFTMLEVFMLQVRMASLELRKKQDFQNVFFSKNPVLYSICCPEVLNRGDIVAHTIYHNRV